MTYKPKKVANCACGTGDTHSLRQSGICDGLRTGVLTQAQAAEQLARLSQGNRDDKRRKGENTDVAPVVVQPEGAV